MIILVDLKYLSLFSGIGGFEYGIQQSNITMECVGYAEIDKYAGSIYERHYPNHFNWGDVTRIRTEELPDFDFLVGGFPCQAFSNSGFRGGFDDTRGTLFFEIARILKDKRPTYFLLENVEGILYNNKGKTFKRILEILASLGYYVKWEILSSKENGNLPQRRGRVFIRGYFRERCGGEILFEHGYYEQTRTGSTPHNVKDVNKKHLKIYESTKKGYKEAFPFDGVLLNRIGRKVCRGIVQDRCTGTLPAQCSWGVVTEDYRVRRLTPIEYERLQGFPDNWTAYGCDGEKITNTQRYKCLGNAVTTTVVTFVINKMFKCILDKD